MQLEFGGRPAAAAARVWACAQPSHARRRGRGREEAGSDRQQEHVGRDPAPGRGGSRASRGVGNRPGGEGPAEGIAGEHELPHAPRTTATNVPTDCVTPEARVLGFCAW